MKKTMIVEGMSCNHCVKAVKNALGELEGVSKVDVDLEAKKVEVEGENLADEKLKEAIEDAGYDVVEIK
ncbi:copper ion binding protein [Tissierella sp. MSJ-40]|uniref:Copper ion binding protein n=1 Tax=Tissierella simiarum TaxID=2841534 RepID=A0ABS6E313_9FIRM|nr:copper ion binding protein [Tissierella simiarum]MBU5437179.1 copper ion binding protein [Tissierella simiarum]